ncbi:MAG: hypothetical protein RQ826_09170 [Xanthomonadales bacterium]|nr:hypothetical protein [Xanthomonadales bacterium]
MKFRVALFVLIQSFLATSLFAANWDSPIDAKYRQRSATLYAQYLQAQQLIDGAGGRSDRLDNAETLLDGILQADPDFAPAHFEQARQIIKSGYLGDSRFREGTLDLAEQTIRNALSIEPEYADAYSLLGHVYTLDGRLSAAQDALTRAEAIGSGSPWLDMNWADLLVKQGRKDEAHSRYLNVLAKGTADQGIRSTALREATRYYEARRDYAEANRWYLKGLELEPDSARRRANYAAFQLYSLGDENAAAVNAEKALAGLDNQAVRKILANALYTQWARGLDAGRSPAELEALAQRAAANFSDTRSAAEALARYEQTRFAGARVFERYGIDPGHALRTTPLAGLYDVQGREAQAQAAKDPVKIWNAALEQQSETPRFHMMREALSLWADTDPFQAIEYVDRLPPGQERNAFHAMALTNAAAIRPLEMLERLDSFPNTRDQRAILGQAMRALGETEGAGAVKRAEDFYSIDRKKMALESAYRGWAEMDVLAAANHFAREQDLGEYPAVAVAILEVYLRKDEPGALRWAEQLDGLGGHVLWSRALQPMAADRPAEALAILAEVPANPDTERGVRSVLETIADARPEMAIAFVEQLPVESLRANVAQRAVMQLAESDPLSAFEWTTTQPPAIQAFVYPGLVTKLAQADLQFVLGIPLESLPHEAQENWVSNVFNEYSKQDPTGAEAWLRQFADHPMYATWQTQVAYRLARQNPHAALESLSRLEPSPRTLSAVDAVVRTWAQKDPLAAAEWVLTQYPDGDNTHAIQSLMNSWSSADYTGAKRWALGLADVRKRDTAISQLYQAQSMNDPRSTEAEDLLRLISDEQAAFKALRAGIMNLSMRDHAAALAYVRTLNLTEDELRQILDGLQR